MKYLNSDGLSHLIEKIKNLFDNKSDVGHKHVVADIVDLTTNTVMPIVKCSTASGTSAKVGELSTYILSNKKYLKLVLDNANTFVGAITLNVNGTGAKPLYINGVASSNTNYSLPADSYLVYYESDKYYIRTDGKITANVIGDSVQTTTFQLYDGVHYQTPMNVYDDGDGDTNYGAELRVGANGNIFVGAGESPTGLRNALSQSENLKPGEAYSAGSENVYLSADSTVYLYSNCNTVANRKGIRLSTGGIFHPIEKETISLGNSSFPFNDIYAKNIYQSGMRLTYIHDIAKEYNASVAYDAGEYISVDKYIYRVKKYVKGIAPPNTTYYENVQSVGDEITAAVNRLNNVEVFTRYKYTRYDTACSCWRSGNLVVFQLNQASKAHAVGWETIATITGMDHMPTTDIYFPAFNYSNGAATMVGHISTAGVVRVYVITAGTYLIKGGGTYYVPNT